MRYQGFAAIGFVAVIASGNCLLTPHAMAETQYEHCNAVLAGDLTDKVTANSASSSSAVQAMQYKTFSLKDYESYDVYKKAIDNRKKQGQKGNLGVPIEGIPVEIAFGINYENELSENQYKQQFNKVKSDFEQQYGKVSSSNTSLASGYASYVRDANSIDAWKACVTREAELGLYAFASRDDSDEPWLNVLWAPGSPPLPYRAIEIDIVLPDGASRTDSTREIAVGNGHTYHIAFPDHKRGFQVSVNGEILKENGEKVYSFTTTTQVPPIQVPPVRHSMPPVVSSQSDCTWGPDTCKSGYVWRMANANDHVCVPPSARAQAAADNAAANSRRHLVWVREGTNHFRTSCLSPYVHRQAFAGDDTVCVDPSVADLARLDNTLAASRIACLR
jgi:hypothetical protein